jgi:polysaccharide export outer membrane protein
VGDVNQPTRIPVDLGGVRVLDAVAQAGGSRFPAYETEVVLQRRGRSASVSLARLMNQPSENVTLAPGDTLQLMRRQRFFLALGASGRSARIEYDADRLSLADGIAKAGGLLDDRADPAGVFVYRFERKPILRDLGLASDKTPELVPTIYKLNLRDPGGLFVAEGFTLRPNDIIYVSNAPTVDFLKFITVVRGITGVARDIAGTARDVDLVIKSSQGGSNNSRAPTIIEQ